MDDFTSQTTSLVQNLVRGAQGSEMEVCMSPAQIEEHKQPLSAIASKSSIRLPSYANGSGEAQNKSPIKVPLITVKACKKIQSSQHLNIKPLSSNQLIQSHTAQKREHYMEIELSDSNDSLESLDDSKAAEAASPLD